MESARRGGNGKYRTGDEGEFEEDAPLVWVVPAQQGPMSTAYERPLAHSIIHQEAPPEKAGRNYVRYPGASIKVSAVLQYQNRLMWLACRTGRDISISRLVTESDWK